uniref:(California timema) hypothetical protein n=1 Tax=Timema californicum TaxID=61474 RepID=A0A7R9P5I2_TIMCA|nr:unnamed protein product [Timema californicum]
MTRHARNCTAGAVYTYHEKKKDAQASGYGTNTQRIGKDSVKDFDCCSLTLQPCRNPVITVFGFRRDPPQVCEFCDALSVLVECRKKDGYLFDKEAILEYICTKKLDYATKMKEYEKQISKEKNELSELAEAEKRSKLQNFLKTEKNIVSSPVKAFKPEVSKDDKPSVSNMINGGDKHLPSFWIPSKTPEAKEKKLKKPDKMIYCPMSGKPLKVKDLIDVKFTLVNDPHDKRSLIAKENRYMCPITHDILSNAVPCAILKTSGDVVTMECVERIIKKDWLHPLTGAKLTERDIITLQRLADALVVLSSTAEDGEIEVRLSVSAGSKAGGTGSALFSYTLTCTGRDFKSRATRAPLTSQHFENNLGGEVMSSCWSLVEQPNGGRVEVYKECTTSSLLSLLWFVNNSEKMVLNIEVYKECTTSSLRTSQAAFSVDIGVIMLLSRYLYSEETRRFQLNFCQILHFDVKRCRVIY